MYGDTEWYNQDIEGVEEMFASIETRLGTRDRSLDFVSKFTVQNMVLKEKILRKLDLNVSPDVTIILGYRKLSGSESLVTSFVMKDENVDKGDIFENNADVVCHKTILVDISGIEIVDFWDAINTNNIVFMVSWSKVNKLLTAAFGFLFTSGPYHVTRSGATTRGDAPMTGYGYTASGFTRGHVVAYKHTEQSLSDEWAGTLGRKLWKVAIKGGLPMHLFNNIHLQKQLMYGGMPIHRMHCTLNACVPPHYDKHDCGPCLISWLHSSSLDFGGGFRIHEWGVKICLKKTVSLFFDAKKWMHGSVPPTVCEGVARLGIAMVNKTHNLSRFQNETNTVKGTFKSFCGKK